MQTLRDRLVGTEKPVLRVLHVAQPVDAGVPNVVRVLTADQIGRGWEVHVACPPASVLAGVAEFSIHRWDAVRSPGVSILKESLALRRIIARIDPDVVHLHSAKAGLGGRLVMRRRRPTIFQPHAWSFEAVTGLRRVLALRWERAAARWTDVILCVSEAERLTAERAGIVGPCEVVPNGIELDRWPEPRDGDRVEARRDLSVDLGVQLVVCVGRLSFQKGQDLLLDAWPEIQSAHPRSRLVFVGDGPEFESLQTRAPSDVMFAGAREDVRAWYLAADLVVLPSRWEGMSLAMLEAMACSRSVVIGDVAGAREVVRGDAGAVVRSRPEEIADAVVRRLGDRDLVSREGAIGRDRVGAELTVDRTAERVASIYERVLEQRQR